MHRKTLESSRRHNRWESLLLLLSMSALLALIGWMLAGLFAAAMAFLIVLLSYLFNSHLPPQLLSKLYRARPLTFAEAPELYGALRELSHRAELPRAPLLYYIDSPVPNAVALGTPDHSAIALSGGLLRQLDWPPLLGVIGHELSHIRHQDLQLLTFAELIGRLTSYLALIGLALIAVTLPLAVLTDLQLNWPALLLLLLAPQACRILHLALSRTREFEADRGCAELLGSPLPLIDALRLLEESPSNLWQRLFLARAPRGRQTDLRTHPSIDERISRLKQLEPARAFRVPPFR